MVRTPRRPGRQNLLFHPYDDQHFLPNYGSRKRATLMNGDENCESQVSTGCKDLYDVGRQQDENIGANSSGVDDMKENQDEEEEPCNFRIILADDGSADDTDSEDETNTPDVSTDTCDNNQENIQCEDFTDSTSYETVDDYESLRNVARRSTEVALLTVMASLVSRETYSDFVLRIDCLDENHKQQAKMLYQHVRRKFSKMYLCNDCGARKLKHQSCCNGVIAEVLRVPIIDQLDDIITAHYTDILKVRESVKNGSDVHHNLNGARFKSDIEKEDIDKIKLSLLMSIDGVQVVGKTKKKIWPVSCAIVDLPTHEMLKSKNIVLCGIILCSKDPSTKVWNSVWSCVNSSIERMQFNHQNHTIVFEVATIVGDQPAKRSFFGMGHYNSRETCFYCTSKNARYKFDLGEEREKHGDDATINASENCKLGFCCYAEVIKKILTFNTIVDIFHNLCEGVLVTIMTESTDCEDRKSDLFIRDNSVFDAVIIGLKIPSKYAKSHEHRNGNAKFDDFRIRYFITALISPAFCSEARFIIIGLGTLCNILATNQNFCQESLNIVCESVHEFMKYDYKSYYVVKLHETLLHLAECCRKFGNVASLSTSMFETYYRVLLSDVKAAMVVNFVDYAAQRYITEVIVHREIEERLRTRVCTEKTENFVKDSRKFEKTSKNVFGQPLDCSTDREVSYFGLLRTKFGHFKGPCVSEDTKDDIVFFDHDLYKCGLFIHGKQSKDVKKIVVEVLEESNRSSFKKLTKCANSMNGRDAENAKKLIDLLKTSRFICQGRFKGRQIEIELNDIRGIGCAITASKITTAVQLSGAAIHV
ncbi:unnamed protein product [Caenorhabditis angaria]|uniref:Uncharacterized protein n=1 Tax=Caenorhabditis angaria TaxID=860376 RepID=A0A9P1MSR7_9PELO|nr:unnamed protein product [Caenorhabditis angaria]